MKGLYLGILLFAFPATVFPQSVTIRGIVTDSLDNPVSGVNVMLAGKGRGTSSGPDGRFRLKIGPKGKAELVFSHINYYKKRVTVDPEKAIPFLKVVLRGKTNILEQLEVSGNRMEKLRSRVSVTSLSPKLLSTFPSATQDISKLLITLPGVSSNNEFSTGYNVRGGNYDENLVYVNDMPVYRPVLVQSGQQEGLSFANPYLIRNLEFYSGGWASDLGDGLSSAMDITYKVPDSFGGSLSIGLLGGSLHAQGTSSNRKITFLVGVRHKQTDYLLNTLETEGEYKPRFTDVQTYFHFDLGKNNTADRYSALGVLLAYSRNNYLVEPTSRESTFGTFEQQLRLFVAFDGRDLLSYDNFQGGLKFTRRFNSRIKSDFTLSAILNYEREFFDIESGYMLCSVDKQTGSDTFDQCVVNLGIGRQYYSGRNLLDAALLTMENRNEIRLNPRNTLEFGGGYALQQFDDSMTEYSFTDSAGYSHVDYAVEAANNLRKNIFTAYLQNTSLFGSNQTLTAGVRLNYLDINGQLLVSPRLQYSIQPVWRRDILFKAAAGLYQQPPFYKEMRDKAGHLNTKLKAQSSAHFILGMDMNFKWWQRPFKFTTEVYYKYLWNVVPYDINNVRIRYFAENSAIAYAMGIDFRISGEFIPGEESWFSLGILQTREDVEGDGRGFIPRPSDQLVKFNIYFSDHLPVNPTYKMFLNLFYASPLPFSPPGNIDQRNSFRGKSYQRVDIGFSKMIDFGNKWNSRAALPNSLWIGLEILNLTGHKNVISYYWVKDVNSNYYAVPNALSARFFNVRLTLSF